MNQLYHLQHLSCGEKEPEKQKDFVCKPQPLKHLIRGRKKKHSERILKKELNPDLL